MKLPTVKIGGKISNRVVHPVRENERAVDIAKRRKARVVGGRSGNGVFAVVRTKRSDSAECDLTEARCKTQISLTVEGLVAAVVVFFSVR